MVKLRDMDNAAEKLKEIEDQKCQLNFKSSI